MPKDEPITYKEENSQFNVTNLPVHSQILTMPKDHTKQTKLPLKSKIQPSQQTRN